MTLGQLRRWYRHYNKRYFKNKLPKRVRLEWSRKLLRHGWVGECDYDPPVIRIADEIHRLGLNRIIREILLHEMAHLKLSPRVNHGKKFKKQIRRLVNLGAYDELL